jgi:plasmid replication initiation protein
MKGKIMKIASVEKHKNNEVKKANELIKAKGVLSENASKMLTMLISMIRVDDSEFQEYALNIKDFLKSINSSSHNTKAIKQTAEELMHNPFWIDGKLFNWCSMVDIEKIDGYIVFDIHKYLKPYLLKLQENFTTYNIVNILSLKGDYTPRLYEYFLMEFNRYKDIYRKKYNKTPKSYTFEIEIDWLRDTLKIPDSYRYNNIKTQIIEVAKKQLKEKTNIKFDYKEDTIGRKVVRLIIKVENNDKGSNDYLSDLQSFIRYVRENLVNKDIWKGQNMILSVDANGRIYDKLTAREYDNHNAQIVWETWYSLAKENKLSIINSDL